MKKHKKRSVKNLGMTLYLILMSFLMYLGAGLGLVVLVIVLALMGMPIDTFREPFMNYLYMIAFVILVGTILSAFFSRYITRPYHALNEATKKVAAGDFSIRIEPKGPREVKEMAASFNTMAKELSSIETLRNDFVGNVSHEFKTPVSSIKGFAKLAKKKSISAETREEYLDFIVREADRLANLTGNILLLSRLEQQEIASPKNDFLLDEQLRHALLLLEPQWSKKDIDVSTALANAPYNGYEELLIQVWVNLIGNAIKFSGEGSKIEVSLSKCGDRYIVKIADTGIGMSEETIGHIFDKFFQGDKSHSEEGNGLGLSLVRRIVDMSEGELSVESVIGSGTTVAVTLPIAMQP